MPGSPAASLRRPGRARLHPKAHAPAARVPRDRQTAPTRGAPASRAAAPVAEARARHGEPTRRREVEGRPIPGRAPAPPQPLVRARARYALAELALRDAIRHRHSTLGLPPR